jgi:RHS repeat-associated protein
VYRQSFDAWGRERNPQDWSYNNIPDDFPFLRGYTGHEHLKWFGLINMNGRMYDASLCRFLSPDPYVQMPDNSQNFNRYSYCLNNPLVYTDPSGKFFVWDSWLVGLVDGFFSSGSNRFDNAWDEANLRAGNDIKIWGGLVATDENKTFGGQVWEVFSRFTWQLPQTIGGFGTAHSYNTFGLDGGVESVDYAFGATVVKTRSDGYWGVSQGNFIVGSKFIEAKPNNSLFQHEYGHYIQSQKVGWFYYSKYGIPSLLSKRGVGVDHSLHPTEQDANIRAYRYFSENVEDFNWVDNFGIHRSKWKRFSNPIIGYNWVLSPDNVHNTSVLNKGRLKLSWYDYTMLPLNLTMIGIIPPGLINSIIQNNQY